MGYKINLGNWNGVFAVPMAVTDNYLKLASGNNIKVLLYFLRHSGENVTIEEISAATGVKPDDINDAFLFWEQVGLLSENEGEFIPSKEKIQAFSKFFEIKTSESSELSEKQERAAESLKKIEIELKREPIFRPAEIAKTIRGSAEIDYLYKQCEILYGKPLKHNEQNTLMIIIEEAGLSVACTLMLVEYCFSIEKATPSYMKTLALNWVEKEINTVEKAEEEIKRLKSFNSVENEIKRLFEIRSVLSKEQKNYIDKWVNEYGFSMEMLDEAYQITLNKAGKLSFRYMNTVIKSWVENGIKNPAQLAQSNKRYKEKTEKTVIKESSFDLEDLTRAALEKYN